MENKNKGLVLSNLCFLLVDVLESSFMEANEELKKENADFKREAKRGLNFQIKLKPLLKLCGLHHRTKTARSTAAVL